HAVAEGKERVRRVRVEVGARVPDGGAARGDTGRQARLRHQHAPAGRQPDGELPGLDAGTVPAEAYGEDRARWELPRARQRGRHAAAHLGLAVAPRRVTPSWTRERFAVAPLLERVPLRLAAARRGTVVSKLGTRRSDALDV